MAVDTRERDRHLRLLPGGDPARHPGNREQNRRTVAFLWISTGFLTFSGLLMVLSASSVSAYAQYGSGFFFFGRQAVYAVVGAAAMFLTSRMRYRVWTKLAGPLLALTLGMLAVVLHPAAGPDAHGASRWIALGPVTLQPSELAKLTLVICAATFLARQGDRIRELGNLVPLIVLTIVVGALVMAQPDLGTTLVIVGTLYLMSFVAGARMSHLASGGVVGLLGGAGLIWGASYRKERFLGFLNPWEDASGRGYQLIQGLIALGSGGLTGVGLGASRQKWLYVPNAHTDFIFAIVGEELGLVGALTMLAAFATLFVGAIRTAMRAPDAFGRLLASGIVAWFGVQTIVNLGAVTGVLPITGVPLPFLSYGGSALVVSLAAVGILVNIARAGIGPSSRASQASRARSAPARPTASRGASTR